MFPCNLLEPIYTDPDDPGKLLGRTEVERRECYIEQLKCTLLRGELHPYVQLMKRCLKNESHERPTAEELVTSLEEMKADIEGPYGDITKADAVTQVVTMRALRKRETEVREKTAESAIKDAVIQQLQEELEHKQV